MRLIVIDLFGGAVGPAYAGRPSLDEDERVWWWVWSSTRPQQPHVTDAEILRDPTARQVDAVGRWGIGG